MCLIVVLGRTRSGVLRHNKVAGARSLGTVPCFVEHLWFPSSCSAVAKSGRSRADFELTYVSADLGRRNR